MLAEQARCAAQLFTGGDPRHPHPGGLPHPAQPDGEPDLVGMPGCGKSTVGRALAAQLDRPFVDTDAELEKVLHMPVGEYITHYGEEAFRKEETALLAQLGKSSGLVIATGGGASPGRRTTPPPPKRRHFLPGAGPVKLPKKGAPSPEGEPGGHVHHPPAHVPPLCGHHRGQRRPGREGGPEVGGSL